MMNHSFVSDTVIKLLLAPFSCSSSSFVPRPRIVLSQHPGSSTRTKDKDEDHLGHAMRMPLRFGNGTFGLGRFLGTCGLMLWTCSLLSAPRPPWTSNRVAGSPNPPAPYTVERLFPKLTFTNPVDIAVLPGSDRLL